MRIFKLFLQKGILLLTVIFFFTQMSQSQTLAPTPPMGWNSWNCFEANINEQLIKEIADAMVSSGMRDAGYNYLVLDDGWMAKERNENGRLEAEIGRASCRERV